LSVNGFDKWADESFKIAKTKVYRKGTLKAGTLQNATVLPEGYDVEARRIGERRMILAGYRLLKL
jgi:hypothetical protein